MKLELSVDKEYQASLEPWTGAGHIAFLALNKALAESYWRKDADRKDPLVVTTSIVTRKSPAL